jgi:hypothetical protein
MRRFSGSIAVGFTRMLVLFALGPVLLIFALITLSNWHPRYSLV